MKNMEKEIIINGITYLLTPKIILTDDEFIEMVLKNKNIDYNIGDVVWFKEESVRCECGNQKYEVISFEPICFLNGTRIDAYLTVNLKNIKTGYLTSYLTSHLKKCNIKLDNSLKTISIDGVEYNLTPKQ